MVENESEVTRNPREAENIKIGVVTFYDKGNYGCVLQAYALHETLIQIGHEPCYITVREKNSFTRLLYKSYIVGDLFLRALIQPLVINNYLMMTRLARSLPVLPQETSNAIKGFVQQNIKHHYLSHYELYRRSRTDEFGAFICGSDQIWSPLPVFYGAYRFLTFAPRCKRIAYAPSFGVNQLPVLNRKRIMKHISGIDHLSVREENGRKMIRHYTGKNAQVVLDPTMLVEPVFWEKRISHAVDLKTECNSYILCYFLSEPEPEQVELIRETALKMHKKVMVIPYENALLKLENARLVKGGPLQFVALVKNAFMVFTNSFHGTAFSLIFNRPFFVFERYQMSEVRQTSRISSLLALVGLEKRLMGDVSGSAVLDEANFQNDWNQVNQILARERQSSMQFLRTALEQVALNQ